MIGRFWSLLLVLLTLACANRAPRPEASSIEGISNAVQVGELLICSQPSPEALKQLASEGYKTVLSTRGLAELSWAEQAQVESLGMTFVSIPMENPVTEITDDQVNRFDSAMTAATGPLVLHCGSGNRVSGLWAVWLVENQKMDAEKALELATQTGMKGVKPAVRERLGLEKAEH